MIIEYLLVFAGGSFGAVCRYALSTFIKRISSTEFPVSTFLINLIGSFLLGILLSSQIGTNYQLLLGTGFMGGFTTFSTFQVENITLFHKKQYVMLFLYSSLSVISCIIVTILGFKIAN